MSKPIHVFPAPGRRVRNPDAGQAVLGPEGAAVKMSVFWRRRIDAGDVTTAAERAPKPAVQE